MYLLCIRNGELNVVFRSWFLLYIIMFGLEKISWTSFLVFLFVALIVFNAGIFLYFLYFKKDETDLKKSKVQKFSV